MENILKFLLPASLLVFNSTLFLRADPQNWIGIESRVGTWQHESPADRVRLSLRSDGLYRVTARELAQAGGWSEHEVVAAIGATNLQMSCNGKPVAWLADGEALIFYGRHADGFYAPENVYWIEPGNGQSILSVAADPQSGSSTNNWFYDTLLFEGTDYVERLSFSSITNVSYLAHGFQIRGQFTSSLQVSLPDVAPGPWTGEVTFDLMSYSASPGTRHRAELSMGEEFLAEVEWLDEAFNSYTFEFDSSNLTNRQTTLNIKNSTLSYLLGGKSSIICISYSFKFAREYRALDERLSCRGGEAGVTAISGFDDNEILVLDITNPDFPLLVDGTIISSTDDGNWQVSFASGDSNTLYHAASDGNGFRQAAIRGARSINWEDKSRIPAYAIIIPPEGWRSDYRPAVQRLATFRSLKGLRSNLVDVEDIYNSYSHGLVEPQAIRQFCRAGYTNGLKYVLLAGAGSFDFRHQRLSVTNHNAALIPAFPLSQLFYTDNSGMSAAGDLPYGDVDGDGRLDLAVGRLPTTDPGQMAVAIAKTISYESQRRWEQPYILTADWENEWSKFYNFTRGVDAVQSSVLGAGKTVLRYDLADDKIGAVVREYELFPALRNGASLFYFFGHTGERTLGGGNPRLLSYDEIIPSNWQLPVISVVIACRANRWHGITATVGLQTTGVFAPGTGFVASLGMTGNIMANEGEYLGKALFESLQNRGTIRLGDMLLHGVREMQFPAAPERLSSFSLVGDPAMIVSTGVENRKSTLFIIQ